MRKSEERCFVDADGNEQVYKVTQFPGEEGFNLLPEIVEMIGDSLAKLATMGNSGGGDFLDQDIDASLLGEALTVFSKKIAEKGGAEFIKKLLAGTTRNGKEFSKMGISSNQTWSFNEAFTGNYSEMFRVVAFVLEANYKSFLSGSLTGILNPLQKDQ